MRAVNRTKARLEAALGFYWDRPLIWFRDAFVRDALDDGGCFGADRCSGDVYF